VNASARWCLSRIPRERSNAGLEGPLLGHRTLLRSATTERLTLPLGRDPKGGRLAATWRPVASELRSIYVDLDGHHRRATCRATCARAIEALHEEFRGIYSLEPIERFVDESIDRLSGARVVDLIPLFVHRFARERLRALAQAQGAIVSDVPEVLFVCVHNAGRSQMAAALLDHHAKGRVHVRSAGSDPGDQINPAVAAAMAEWGIDLSREFPKPLTDEFVKAADVVITMGCGDACPIYPGKRYEDWELDDPAGQPVEVVRRIRDDIDLRVQALLAELAPASA
jgi:arsenate reductase (thioredoxin)